MKDLAAAANRVAVNELNAYQVRALSSSFHALLAVASSVIIIIITHLFAAMAKEAVGKISSH